MVGMKTWRDIGCVITILSWGMGRALSTNILTLVVIMTKIMIIETMLFTDLIMDIVIKIILSITVVGEAQV